MSCNLTTNYDNFVCLYLCIYAQTAITKKLEVETRLKFTIRYKINWRAIFWYFYIKQEAFFSNPKKYDILLWINQSLAVRHSSKQKVILYPFTRACPSIVFLMWLFRRVYKLWYFRKEQTRFTFLKQINII